MKKTAPHGAPRRDIRSPWRQLLSLPISCHVHWPRSCCQSHARARLPYAENLVSGAGLHTCNGVRSWAVPARGVRSCGVRRLRDPGQRHGCGGSVSGVAGGRRPLEGSYSRPGAHAGTVCGWACRGLGDAVRSGGAGLSVRGRLGSCGVRWLFQGCCSGRRVGHWAAIAWREGGFRKCS